MQICESEIVNSHTLEEITPIHLKGRRQDREYNVRRKCQREATIVTKLPRDRTQRYYFTDKNHLI